MHKYCEGKMKKRPKKDWKDLKWEKLKSHKNYGTFCIMDQQLNNNSKLNTFVVGIMKINGWERTEKLLLLNPKPSDLGVIRSKSLKSFKDKHEFVAKNREELRRGVKG